MEAITLTHFGMVWVNSSFFKLKWSLERGGEAYPKNFYNTPKESNGAERLLGGNERICILPRSTQRSSLLGSAVGLCQKSRKTNGPKN